PLAVAVERGRGGPRRRIVEAANLDRIADDPQAVRLDDHVARPDLIHRDGFRDALDARARDAGRGQHFDPVVRRAGLERRLELDAQLVLMLVAIAVVCETRIAGQVAASDRLAQPAEYLVAARAD